MLLLIQTYPNGNAALARHWPYFLKSGADEIWIVTTNDDNDLSMLPKAPWIVKVGDNSYISGRMLPQRLVDTIKTGLGNPTKFPFICVCEYDTLFFNRLPTERMEHAIAAHYAGGPTFGSKSNGFYHNPYLFHREAAAKFVECAQEVINSGVCDRAPRQPDPPEASPDVFFALVCEQYDLHVQGRLWFEYSRNSLDIPGHLEEAREARRGGAVCIHGVKHKFELDFILS